MKFTYVDGAIVPVDELQHHGVKGMKWGVRRYQNKDGSLTPAGIKRYAKKGYAQDSLNMNKSAGGRAYDRLTGSHKLHADAKYETASKKQRKERAEQYVKERNKKRSRTGTQKVADGAVKAAKVLRKIGTAYLTDQIFFNGVGTKIAAATVKQTGRAFVTAYVMARGGYDIRWYDN